MDNANRMRLLIFSLIFMASCSPYKRVARLIKNHPYVLRDCTIVVTDSIPFYYPKLELEKMTLLENLRRDTFVIHNDRLTVKTFIHRDSIWIQGECAEIDTTLYNTITVTKYILPKTTIWDNLKKYLWLIITGAIVLIGLRIWLKR